MAKQPTRRQQTFRVKAITVAVASCFAVSAEAVFAAQAVLPTGGAVVSGQVSPFDYKGNTLSITSQSNAVINWQAFSIGQNGKVIFYQPSAANSVLNRVVGVDPSVILGAMQSNGRVFLINPNGVLFGAGAKIDVAGLVVSTLNLSNADFLAGRMRFTETPGAGKIENQGAITTPSGGQVYLIAPDIKNSGIITSPQGEVILAAGRSVEIVDAATPSLRVEITAPDTQAVNIGQIIAGGGKIGIFAGLIKNSGEIRADGVVVGKNGEILLRATKDVTLEAGSVVSASGPTAGKITIQSDAGSVAITGAIEANATQGAGGTINISAPKGITADSGARISATGTQGGSVTLVAGRPATANITVPRPSENTLSANTAALVPGRQISVTGTQNSGTLTVDIGKPAGPATVAAGGDVTLAAAEGAIAVQGTIDVSGTAGRGGNVNIIANSDITLDATSRLLANGRAGGEMRIEATKGTLLASGLIEGRGSDGPGGKVYLLAPRVALIRRALIDVSGALGGGLALIGGDFQGRNPLIQNASRTYFGPDAVIRADAITSGDGGKVIVWSDDGTQAYGTISARGGALSGNGGFVETSGKAWLDFAATVNTSAPHGAFGTLLLDPKNIDVNDTGGAPYGGNNLFTDNIGGDSIIKATGAGSISAQGSNVLLQADNDITFSSPINNLNSGVTLTAQAGRSILVRANITMTNADITLIANENGLMDYRDAGAASIIMSPGNTINAGTGTIYMVLREGTGHSGGAGYSDSGNIVIENLIAANVSMIHDGLTNDGSILRASGSSLITATNSLYMEIEFASGTGSLGTQAEPLRIDTPALEAHYHFSTGGIYFDSPNARDLQIGGVPLGIFGGAARGVQTLSSGPIEITVNGKLTQFAGAAICGTSGGTGGPICAGPNPGYAPGDTVTLRAIDMDLQKIVSGWDVNLWPLAGGTITLGSLGTGGSLHLSSAELAQVSSFTLNIGEQDVSGDVTFAGDLATPAIFGIRTGGSITSGANTLIVGGGSGTIDLYAKTGIQLNVQTGTLSAYNVTSGNINIAETSGDFGLLTLDYGTAPFSNSLRNDAATGDITLTTTTRSIAVVNSITSQRDLTLTSGGGDIIIGSPSNAVLVNAGQDIFINAAGVLSIEAGDTTLGSGTVRDMSAKVHANRDVVVNAAGINIEAGNAQATGSVVGESATADAELTAGRDMTLTVGNEGLFVVGGNAQVNAEFGDVYDASANAKLAAVGNLTMTVAGGGLLVVAGQANAAAQSGSGAQATANANALVSAGAGKDLSITVNGGGGIFVIGGNANAQAYHVGSGGGSGYSSLVGNNTASASANATLSAGRHQTITLTGGNFYVGGGSATASAYKTTNCCSGSNMLSGNNTATADANVTLETIGAAGNLTINLGDGLMEVGGNHAYANAFHTANYGPNNALINDNTATANASIKFTAGNALTVSGTNASILRVGANYYASSFSLRPTAHASAYKRTYSGSFSSVDGTNQATATADLIFSAAGAGAGALGITVGELNVRGGEVFAQAYHRADYGNMNTLAGDNTATANSEVSFKATNAGGSLSINVGSGPLTVTGATTSLPSDGTRAFKHVNGGSNHDLTAGNNTATAVGEVKFSAGSNVTVTAGSLTVNNGGGAAASADKTVNGSGASGNQLGGTNMTTAAANMSFTAGNNLTINLGGGQMTVNGAPANAWAYHVVGDGGEGFAGFNNNTVGGNNSATATANTSFTATGGALTVNAGGIYIYGARARAEGYKLVNAPSYGSATNNTLSGNNTATANSNISLTGATAALNGGSGNLYIFGNSASAFAKQLTYASGSNYLNNLSGNHTATASSNISLTATGGALTVDALQGIYVNAVRAQASAYKNVYGGSNTVAGDNTATANGNITLSGTSITLNAGVSSIYFSGGRASGLASHYVNGSMNSVSGNHTANATSNVAVTASGGPLQVTAGGMRLADGGEGAGAFAHVSMYAGGSNNIVGGVAGPASNTATANHNLSLSGTSITLDLGGGSLDISGARAQANATNHAFGYNNNLSAGQTATANSNVSLTTGGALTVNATGGVYIYGSNASAEAYKYVNGSSHTLAGNNTTTANSNISLGGASIALNLGGGNLYISGDSADARAYHSAYGVGQNLSGSHTATATSNISLAASSGALTVDATGGVQIYGDSAYAQAKKYVSGSSHMVSGNNTATANSNISLTGVSVALNLGGGSLYVSGSSASARAYYSANGFMNNLSGTHSATANSMISLTATGGALTVDAAGGVNLYGSAAFANVYKYVTGDSHTIAGGNTAVANSSVNLSGATVALNLGTAGLNVDGAEGGGFAINSVGGNGNVLSGNQTANAFSNLFITAGTDLSVQAGNINVYANSAQAAANNAVIGTGNNVSGANSATMDANVRLAATNGNLSLTVGAGSVYVNGSSAVARALDSIAGGNTVTATNTATAHSNALVASSGDMTINVTSGGLYVQGGYAQGDASGAGVADANANAGIFSLGAKTVNVGGAVVLTGGNLSLGGGMVSAFAMLDPGSLDLTANTLTLTPNTGGVIVSADGPINLTIGGVSTPLSSYAASGNILGTGTLTSGDPIIVDIGGTSVNVSARFGLPAAFLNAGPGINTWTGLAGDFLWASGGNWSLGHEPNVFETAQIFDLTGTPTISILSGAHTPKAFQFFGDDNFLISGGSLTFTNPSSIVNGILTLGGTLTANSTLTANTLNLTSGGMLNGTGSVTVTNAFSQTSGTLNIAGTLSATQAAGNLAISNSFINAAAITLIASAGNIDVQDTTVTSTGAMNLTASNNLNLTAVTTFAILESTGMQTIDANGINVQGASTGSNRFASIRSFGGQNITADAGGITLTGGGGTGSFNSADIYQTSAGNPQLITVNGGGTIQISGGSGSGGNNFAYIWNQSTGSPQTINFSAGGALILTGGTVGNNSSALLENDAGVQTIAGNAAIQLAGGNSGSGNYAWLLGSKGQNISASGITLAGGTGAGTGNSAAIEQQGAASNQTITINGAGIVSLTGGGGTQSQAEIFNLGKAQSLAFTGAGTFNAQGGNGAGGQNFAGLQNQGAGATTQTVSFTGGGALNLTGGTVGADNNAGIHANTGNQTITGNPNINLTGGASGGGANTSNDAGINLKLGAGGVQSINAGTLALTGGAGGIENGAFISAETSGQTQIINTTGAVTLTGGAGMDALVGIATNSGNLNATLNAGGAVTLTGGSGGFTNFGAFAAIGAIGGFNANVTVNGQAGITLTKGTGPNANAMIGSDTGGGTVTLKAGLGGAGNLVLNDGLVGTTGNVTLQATAPGGQITQSAAGIIKANTLTTTSDGGALLIGANQVAIFNANNISSGNVSLNNAAATLTVTGINDSGGGNISVTNTGDIDLAGAVTSIGGGVTLNSGNTLFGTGVITGSTINLTSVSGMSVIVNNNGVNLTATNSGATGNIALTSIAPLFTIGGGGATFNTAAPGGQYLITAQNNMALNGGTANNRQALFGAGGMLTVNGYTNASGAGVLMLGSNVTFNGAPTNVSGALGVIGGNIDVNTTVQGGSISVATGALNVNGGDFQSTAGNFVGTVSGDINVSGGGRIYGNPDVDLTVGGTIYINGANSMIEAFSPNSIRIQFPLIAQGGYLINGAPVVWDPLTNTGFYIGQTGLPAVLGQSLLITYSNGLAPFVLLAINETGANSSIDGPSNPVPNGMDALNIDLSDPDTGATTKIGTILRTSKDRKENGKDVVVKVKLQCN